MKKIHRKMTEDVEPIKSKAKLRALMNEFKAHRHGTEMVAVFIVSLALLLRSSDALKLRTSQVYKRVNGRIHIAHQFKIYDQKTGKPNILKLGRPTQKILKKYYLYRKAQHINSSWLFPAIRNKSKHLSRYYYYEFIKRSADNIGFKHIGTHSARKTGAYMAYKSCGSLAIVMHLLNQSSERITELYLGIKGKPETDALNGVNKGIDSLKL